MHSFVMKFIPDRTDFPVPLPVFYAILFIRYNSKRFQKTKHKKRIEDTYAVKKESSFSYHRQRLRAPI